MGKELALLPEKMKQGSPIGSLSFKITIREWDKYEWEQSSVKNIM